MIRPRFSWFVLALAPLAVLHSASCGEADTAPSDAGTGPILEPVDWGKKADTGSSVDSAVPNVRLPPILPSCVGVSIPMRTSGEKSYVAVPRAFLMQAPRRGTRGTPGPTHSPLVARAWATS